MSPGVAVRPREVDALGCRAREALDLRSRADGDDAAAADRERLGNAIFRIHGQDPAARQDPIGVRVFGTRGGAR